MGKRRWRRIKLSDLANLDFQGRVLGLFSSLDDQGKQSGPGEPENGLLRSRRSDDQEEGKG